MLDKLDCVFPIYGEFMFKNLHLAGNAVLAFGVACSISLAPSSGHANPVENTQLKCKGNLSGQYLGGPNGPESQDKQVVFEVEFDEFKTKQLWFRLPSLGVSIAPFKCNFDDKKYIFCKKEKDVTQVIGSPPISIMKGTPADFTGSRKELFEITVNRSTGLIKYYADQKVTQVEPMQYSLVNKESGVFECEKSVKNRF